MLASDKMCQQSRRITDHDRMNSTDFEWVSIISPLYFFTYNNAKALSSDHKTESKLKSINKNKTTMTLDCFSSWYAEEKSPLNKKAKMSA